MKITSAKAFQALFLTFLIGCTYTALPNRILGRNLFVLLVILLVSSSIIFTTRVRVSRHNFLLALFLFLLGMSQSVWFFLYGEHSDRTFLANKNYPITSHYLILSAISVVYIDKFKQLFDKAHSLNYLAILATIGFTYMVSIGFVYCYNNPGMRLRIDAAATITAYILTLQSMLTVHIVCLINDRFKIFLLSWVIGLSFIAILLTQTRSAIFTYPIILILFLLKKSNIRKKHLLSSSLAALVLLPLVVKGFFPSSMNRIYSSYTEISTMDSNNDTSIGARFSMWKAGIYAIEQYPLGQSASSRYSEVTRYINSFESNNREAKRNAVFHLHNDLIENISLQGFLGGLIFLGLILALVHSSYKDKNLSISASTFILPMILYGLVDTLFIDKRFTIIFCAQILLYKLLSNNKSTSQ